MFKIQKFFRVSRHFLTKFQIPKVKPKLQSLKPLLISSAILLPAMMLSTHLTKLKVDTVPSPNINRISNGSTNISLPFKYVNDLISLTATAIRDGKLDEAKTSLQRAIQMCDDYKYYEKLPYLFELLSTVLIQEGNRMKAEEVLVRSIEKLAEVGYNDETANEIIQLKLLLSRLYHLSGNKEMANLGFRSCVLSQENKLKKASQDDATQMLYLNTMFWYAVFLTEENHLSEAKAYMEKVLNFSKSTDLVEDAQVMVILHNLAELSFKLKDFDDAISYLTEALRLCAYSPSLNAASPLFMLKLGLVFLVKEMYKKSEYWCSIAHKFAKATNNHCVENEARLCLDELKKKKLEKDSATEARN